jgi:hypothetical protein
MCSLVERVLTVLISHQRAPELELVLDAWRQVCPAGTLLLVHGGRKTDFAQVTYTPKLFVDDWRLRTRDHQRDLQNWGEVFRTVSRWLQSHRDFEFVHVVEYDHLPLVPDLHERTIACIDAEHADVLAFHLQRVDETSHPHFLYHISDPRFMAYWKSVSVRSQPEVVLSMFGSGSFWRREAFLDVAEREEPFPMYLEIYLPTMAHHLGYRVRDFGEQNRFVHNLGDRKAAIDEARSAGAWTLHPVKHLSEQTII